MHGTLYLISRADTSVYQAITYIMHVPSYGGWLRILVRGLVHCLVCAAVLPTINQPIAINTSSPLIDLRETRYKDGEVD